MRKTLSKTDILRGYESFAEVVRNGVRVRSGCLLCHVVTVSPGADKKGAGLVTGVVAGFAVPKRRFPRAVDRNRIRRLMREAYRMNADGLRTAAEDSSKNVKMVLVFQQRGNAVVHKESLRSMQDDWNEIAAKILASME